MLLVVAIIGILAALVIPKIVGQQRTARARRPRMRTSTAASNPRSAQYEVDNGFYPKSLQDLIVQPGNAKNWHGPYLDKLPEDPWGNPYIYYYPGKHNTSWLRPAFRRAGRQGRNGR